ncbi:MAG: polyphosphate kinase 1 [Saprospiraceae bacterium]|uniref:Polyphosphate kinase n=1 Tax=Candidatus Opimibacter skivensis TaxID=2982028 RepID=A0A9D7SQE6_9BACT|nr:polyphosphate kinase 1 [Candidatus Opimibacter skivensis]
MAKDNTLKSSRFIHRDISWLDFNYRVLQEAKDPNVPLFERLKFLAIYSSNLDEFFRVRVANHRNLLRVGKKTMRQLDYDPEAVLLNIQKVVSEHAEEFSLIFMEQIVPELKRHDIHLVLREDLTQEQEAFVDTFFQDNLLPFVQPVLLVKEKIRPFLNNAALYLAIAMKDKDDQSNQHHYGIIKIPSDHLPRFIELPTNKPGHELIMLDDIVRHSVMWLFPGYQILDTYSIKLTRDGELYIDDEYQGDLVKKIKSSLAKRDVGPASRLVYDKTIPTSFLHYLMDVLGVEKLGLFPEGRYHNNFDFFNFPSYGKTHLKDQPLPPMDYAQFAGVESIFEPIRSSDHLIHIPYHKYEPVIQFFEHAARDPNVTHIKIVQYRVAPNSRIMDALINAVKSGKQVYAFIEVKARFDEEANLRWGEQLERAGIIVRYSFPGLKVHSKIALVRRIEKDGPQLYSYLSTGNFHEVTAKIYSDLGLFTADPRITNEIARIFSFLETVKLPNEDFKHLLVGQFNLRKALTQLIEFEMAEAIAGREASIRLKLNSLQDEEMIEKLYEASDAGVKIELNIRGICSLVAGKKHLSQNINAFSIVDRFLEHSRVFIFHHGGNEVIYLSSADWMERNLSFRIETSFPIFDPRLIAEIKDILNIQSSDNVKSRSLNYNHINEYNRHGSDLAVRSQHETYYYLRRKNDEALKLMNPE